MTQDPACRWWSSKAEADDGRFGHAMPAPRWASKAKAPDEDRSERTQSA